VSQREIEQFVADSAPDAYEKLVDRVLASSHYGERWGRHWLDVARYADSDGMESDADRPDAYHYRDFVIKAFNDDLSYQTFVRWQLAGDEYEPQNPEAISATGFLAAAPTEVLTVPMEEERLRLRFNELDDMAATTANALLGLTLGCARCHDHKFDAIPTRDYYRIQCAFTTTARDNVLLVPRDQAQQYRAAESEWSSHRKVAQKKLNDYLAEQKKLKAESAKLSDDAFRKTFTDEQKAQWQALKQSLEEVEKSKPARPPAALAITDTKPQPEKTFLLNRGDFYSRKEPLQVGFLSVLTNGKSPEDYFAAARSAVKLW